MDPAYFLALIVVLVGVALIVRANRRDEPVEDNTDQNDNTPSGGGFDIGFHVPNQTSK